MSTTVTIKLGDEASAAYVLLRSGGVDADGVVEDALIRNATRLRDRAVEAAHVRDDELQRTQLEDLRNLPPQIEYVRPPR
jgi:hypothetical protein